MAKIRAELEMDWNENQIDFILRYINFVSKIEMKFECYIKEESGLDFKGGS